MGIMAGDINVASLPATIKLAFYLEYQPGPADGERLEVTLQLLQDEEEIMSGKFLTNPPLKKSATFVIPTGLVVFEKAANLRAVVTVNGRPPQEVINKRVDVPPTA